VSHPNAADKNKQAAQWLRGLLIADVAVLVPEIADYELRRELLRADKARSVAVLDRYKASVGYVPLTTEAMLLVAQFWATARQKGKPPAPDLALDADVILAAQAEVLRSGGEDDIVIATTNEGHLSRLVPAQAWQNVGVT
jgi:predicted nucleic acid-binding protein